MLNPPTLPETPEEASNAVPGERGLEPAAKSSQSTWIQEVLSHITEYDIQHAIQVLSKISMALNTSNSSDVSSQGTGEMAEPTLFERAFGTIRFRSTVRFSHPSAALDHVELKNVEGRWQPVLWVNFIGLAGIQGALPMIYSERVFRNMRAKDFAAATFLDLFNHRLVQLFYDIQTWIPGSAFQSADRSRLGRLIQSLNGVDPSLLHEEASEAQHLRDVLTFKTLFWPRVRSADRLQQCLRCLLNMSVTIREYRGGSAPLPENEISRLGPTKGQHWTLGRDVLLGETAWFPDQGVDIILEPTTPEAFERLNPYKQSELIQHLRRIVSAYIPQHIRVHWEVKNPDQEGGTLVLGSEHYLGFNSWIGHRRNSSSLPLREAAAL